MSSGTSDTVPLRAQLAERTADLQRLKAEYDNYRKRVRRDRLAVRQIAVANVLRTLLPVLDALDAAAERGRLTGDLADVAALLQDRLAALGLESFGACGEAFDPTLHEALRVAPGGLAEDAACVQVLRPGYRVADQLLRPAQVTVGHPPGG